MPDLSPAAAAGRAGAGGGALCGRDHAGDGRADRSAPTRNDPIARQFVPDAGELDVAPNERADPIGDHAHARSKGIVHRYPDRVLLKLVHVCAVYCRFCFRREMVGPGKDTALSRRGLARRARLHPRAPRDLGGDPHRRRSADAVAAPAARRSCAISPRSPHVKIMRYAHARAGRRSRSASRARLVAALKVEGATTWVALHANHPRELTRRRARPPARGLLDAGIPLVSQTVLLSGVNDDAATLEALDARASSRCRIKPYYLHHGDLAPGTAHLRTTHRRGPGADARAARARVGPVPAGPMCSTFRAATARRRSVRATWSGRTASPTIAARCIFIRRQRTAGKAELFRLGRDRHADQRRAAEHHIDADQ